MINWSQSCMSLVGKTNFIYKKIQNQTIDAKQKNKRFNYRKNKNIKNT